MRALLLTGIVAVLALCALVRPRIGLYGYAWFALMRPDRLAWVYGENYYSLALALCTLIGTAVELARGPQRLFELLANPFTRLIGLLVLPVTMSAVFAVDPQLSWSPLNLYLRMIVMALLAYFLISTKEQLGQYILVIAVSLSLLGAKFGLFGVLHGGVRFAAGYGGMMSDNNSLAMALAMGVPLCWFARGMVTSRWVRLGLTGTVVLNIAAVIMTFSRGAAISMGAGLMMMAWRSKYRVAAILAIIGIVIPLVVITGPEYLERLSTLTSIEEEASAYSRIVLARAGLALFADHPLTGVGFGRLNQQALLGGYLPHDSNEGARVIHNTYVQVLTDSGLFAFLLFAGLLFGSLVYLEFSYRRVRRSSPELACFPLALQSAMLVYAVDSMSLSRFDFDLLYILAVCVAIWYDIERRPQELVEPEPESASAVQTGRPSLRRPAWLPARDPLSPVRVRRAGELTWSRFWHRQENRSRGWLRQG